MPFQNTEFSNEAERIASEYEDFAYVVSHDLNAPLRHVREFTRLLVGARNDNMSEEEQDYVRFLETSLKKLDDMQQALLKFSRLNTRAAPKTQTDCNIVVTRALKDLEESIEKHCPAIECAELPTVNADANQLQILFHNLIDNALKFHEADAGKRKIQINATDQGDSWLFEVKDNGMGIPEKYQDEVLRLFRRLNPENYEGIGAGLTIAHKIVQRHGGELLIESNDGEQGTSVFFNIEK